MPLLVHGFIWLQTQRYRAFWIMRRWTGRCWRRTGREPRLSLMHTGQCSTWLMSWLMQGRAESVLHATEKLGLMSKPVLVMAGRSRSADQAASRNQHQAIDQGHDTWGSRGAIKQELNLHLGIREVPRDVAGIARGASDQCVEGSSPGVHWVREKLNVFDVH